MIIDDKEVPEDDFEDTTVNPEDDEDDVVPDPEGDEDDAEEGTETDPDAAGDEPPAKEVSRGTARVQKLAKERDAAAEEAKTLRQRLVDVEAAHRNDPARAEQERAEAARVAAMDPAERERYEDRKLITTLQAQVQNLGFSQADGLDRARFEAKTELNPVYKKYAAEVETALQDMRTKGVNTTREAILTFKLGEAARKKLEAGAVGGQKRKAAAEGRVAKVNGRSANIRSDAPSTGKGKTEEDRLRGVQI